MDDNGGYDCLFDGGVAGTTSVTINGTFNRTNIQAAAEALIPVLNAAQSPEADYTLTSIRAYGSELITLEEE